MKNDYDLLPIKQDISEELSKSPQKRDKNLIASCLARYINEHYQYGNFIDGQADAQYHTLDNYVNNQVIPEANLGEREQVFLDHLMKSYNFMSKIHKRMIRSYDEENARQPNAFTSTPLLTAHLFIAGAFEQIEKAAKIFSAQHFDAYFSGSATVRRESDKDLTVAGKTGALVQHIQNNPSVIQARPDNPEIFSQILRSTRTLQDLLG
jgi:hypothetical protein